MTPRLIKNRITGGKGYWKTQVYTTPEGSKKRLKVWTEVQTAEQVAAEIEAKKRGRSVFEKVISFAQGLDDSQRKKEGIPPIKRERG